METPGEERGRVIVGTYVTGTERLLVYGSMFTTYKFVYMSLCGCVSPKTAPKCFYPIHSEIRCRTGKVCYNGTFRDVCVTVPLLG